jgi:RNA polymerase sigma factor (sigma-70 family)
MNVHFSYKLRRTPDIDREIQHWTEKIQKRLQVFRPDLVHLKGLVEQNTPREGTTVSLNLRLPSGQMAAQESADGAAAAIKAAFDDLLAQIGRHKELLRNSHRRHRRASQNGRGQGTVPFEKTLAAIPPLTATAEDVRHFVNANFSRLERFVERELFFREASSDLEPESLSAPEVVDEVAARALDDHVIKPDRIALEHWFYRLAIQVMNDFQSRLNENEGEINLQAVRRRRDEHASDEARLQFHQPDETMTAESSIPDDRVTSPEDIAYTDEIIALVQYALRGAVAEDREAFILHALEGFSAGEIAAITDRNTEQVRQAISRAREKVRSSFRSVNTWKAAQRTGTH